MLCEGDTVDNASIIEGVRQVVMKTPIDVRASTLSNIVLIGGTAMIPGALTNTRTCPVHSCSCSGSRTGFASRLVDELAEALREEPQLSVLADRIDLASLHFPRNMLPWVGASVFAATESARATAISASEYANSSGVGLAGDWLAVA
jgi:actin-related protein